MYCSWRGEVVSFTQDSMRVLFVDDEPILCTAFRRLLGPRFEVVAVGTGAEALSRLATDQFDVIVVDINLPDMTGPALFELLSVENARRVLFTTGGSVHGSPLGPERTLLKPFAAEEIRQTLQQFALKAATRDG
jgi:CheY-like chemotaxis protein